MTTDTADEQMTVEEYAIELVADGAQSCAEDDLNEDGKVSDEDHHAAMDLALDIARAIRENPPAVLALVGRAEPVGAVLRAAFAVIEVRLGRCPEYDDCASAFNHTPHHQHKTVIERLREWANHSELAPEAS